MMVHSFGVLRTDTVDQTKTEFKTQCRVGSTIIVNFVYDNSPLFIVPCRAVLCCAVLCCAVLLLLPW